VLSLPENTKTLRTFNQPLKAVSATAKRTSQMFTALLEKFVSFSASISSEAESDPAFVSVYWRKTGFNQLRFRELALGADDAFALAE
jgi:hypothetical protein